jgi:ferredoxin
MAEKTEVYYFTGTGNSLVVARDIAKKLNGKLTSIASVINQKDIKINADVIGIVFPVYYETYGGVPLIVKKFIKKLKNIKQKYIFAVCTYGSGAFVTLKSLDKIIQSQGGELAAGFTVNMPENMAAEIVNNSKNQKKMFGIWEKNIQKTCDSINARKKGKFDSPNAIAGKGYAIIKILGSTLLSFFKNQTLKDLQKYSESSSSDYDKLIPLMDKSFRHNEKCNGCGTCVKVCPVNNIKLINSKPEWQHHCEFCLACYHWCPREAIYTLAYPKAVRYHHPDVTVLDMVKQKRS